MIMSMTGFGKGAENSPYGKITVEIKTLNHKSLSITCNPFNGLFLLEEKLKSIFDKKLFRGKVFVRVECEGGENARSFHKIEINESIAREYLGKIKKMQKTLDVRGNVEIRDLLNFPGVVETASEGREEEVWQYVKRASGKALEKLLKYRKDEGARLVKDLAARLKKINKELGQVKKYSAQSVKDYRGKLAESIHNIAKNETLDKGRLETEVALFAKNCDVAEETTRLDGHLDEYEETLNNSKSEAGKKLDFISQEMQREVNTIGAKSSDFRISKAVIEMKSEIEKMREQIKNIE